MRVRGLKKKTENKKKRTASNAQKKMEWDWSTLFIFLGFVAWVASFVMLIIACTQQQPFNMNSRTEGLLVVGALAMMGVYFVVFGIYGSQKRHYERWMNKEDLRLAGSNA